MNTTIPILMVVKHIRVNAKNKKAWERKLSQQRKDWTATLVIASVVLVAAVGLFLLSALA